MKTYSLCIIAFCSFMTSHCTTSKTSTNNNIVNENKISNIEKIELKEQTRGTNKLTTYTSKGKITVLNGTSTSEAISTTEWNNLVNEANKIDLQNISKLVAPSTNSYSDGALATTLSITSKGKMYSSVQFDSGNPPKELEGLYKKIHPNTMTKKK